MTQLSRLGEARKIEFTKAKIAQVARYFREGSALAGTMVGGPDLLETQIDIESNEPVARVRELVKLAEQTCYALQTLIGTMPVESTATLNGEAIALD